MKQEENALLTPVLPYLCKETGADLATKVRPRYGRKTPTLCQIAISVQSDA